MGSCCTKSSVVEEEPPLRVKHASAEQGIVKQGSSAHRHRHSEQNGHQSQTRLRSKEHAAVGAPATPPSQPRRPRSKEIEKPGDHNPKPSEAPRRPPSSQAPAEKKKASNVRVGSNIKDNKETVPLGKRTNFGYDRDFKSKYTLGKLLGHGQFGYTYVAIEKATGEKVAVKTIEKKQVSNANPY